MTVWLPYNPPRPCPPILTAEDVCVYFRINANTPASRNQAVLKLRIEYGLPSAKLGRELIFKLEDVQRVADELFNE